MTIHPITDTRPEPGGVSRLKAPTDRRPLTQDRLRELLRYEPETGHFFWRKQRGPNAQQGQLAGAADDEGYIVIRVDMRIYKAHRLAFLYVTGELPVLQVDHINGKTGDNRWMNLRQATAAENAHNRRTPKTNTSGYIGVTWHKTKRKWIARIGREHLGYFDDAETASRAYLKAKAELHPFQPTPRT